MKRKTYIINNIKYYSLHAVTPAIGLTYHEVYHNYEKWEEPLGLLKFRNRIFCLKQRAQTFMRLTPGYVPMEYSKKRSPFAEGKNNAKANSIKVIHGSVWTRKLSRGENKA